MAAPISLVDLINQCIESDAVKLPVFNTAASRFRAALNSACSRLSAALDGFLHPDDHTGLSSCGRLCCFIGAGPGIAQQHERGD